MDKFHVISVVGLGLMGASLAKALKETNDDSSAMTCYGINRSGGAIERALADGVISDGAGLADEPKKVTKLLKASDLVVICLYPESILPFLEQYHEAFQPGTLVMDFCGLKGFLVDKAQAMMPEGVEYMGTHPMSGKEKSGYAFASSELYFGGNFILTPTDKNTEQGIQKTEELARLLGCAKIRRISPEEHDKMIAYTSQLPHVMAAALLDSWEGTEDVVSFAGGSFRDATRVSEINASLWTELFIKNKEALLETISRFQLSMSEMADLINSGEDEELRRFLEETCERKRRWNQKGDRYDDGKKN